MNSIMVFDEGNDKTIVVEMDNIETFSEYEKENIFDNEVRKVWHKQVQVLTQLHQKCWMIRGNKGGIIPQR